MEIIYKIKPFSSFDNYTVASITDNVSIVIDKLIRITAKVTEQFAGDIWYDIRTLLDAQEGRTALNEILIFRESGISTHPVSKTEEGYFVVNGGHLSGIQCWNLKHDPERNSTVLSRVYLANTTQAWDYIGM